MILSFQQFVILCLLINYSAVSYGSFKYAFYAIEKGLSGKETVMVLGTIQSMTVGLLGYAFNYITGAF